MKLRRRHRHRRKRRLEVNEELVIVHVALTKTKIPQCCRMLERFRYSGTKTTGKKYLRDVYCRTLFA